MKNPISRRSFAQLSAAGVLGAASASWLPAFAADTAKNPKRQRSCILLWMGGGPATIDLWDLKPGQDNGGPFKEIATSSPDIRIGEHLSKLAPFGDRLGIVRGMSTREGDHSRATYYLRTGYVQQGALQYPTLGSFVSKEIGDPAGEMPSFISIGPYRQLGVGAYSSGYLGPSFAPLIVGEGTFGPPVQGSRVDTMLKVQDIELPKDITTERASNRIDLLKDLQSQFAADRPNTVVQSQHLAYQRAVNLMKSVGSKAFELSQEKEALRDEYGRNLFGQGCLLARRLVESGVPFVEVNLNGWDTHQNNFDQVKNLSTILDAGFANLMKDLKDRGLLETTTILCMGEFGRTPRINGNRGRDHFPNAWSAVLAGGGIKGGQVHGKTSADGMTIEEGKTDVPDLLTTLATALGIDPNKTNNSNTGRPIRIVDKAGKAIQSLVG